MEYRQLEDNYELRIMNYELRITTGSAKQILRLSEGRAYRQIMICPNDGNLTASSKPLSQISPPLRIFLLSLQKIFSYNK